MYEYELVRSKRKTVTMEITTDGGVRVRAPTRMAKRDIDRFVEKYTYWIDEKLALREKRLLDHPEPSEAEIPKLKKQAKQYLGERVAYYSEIMGLYPTGIKITSAKKRFGSCNWQKSLCFSWRLMLYPKEAIDYIVVHELAHLKYMDHSKSFHALVAAYMPDWKARREMLR